MRESKSAIENNGQVKRRRIAVTVAITALALAVVVPAALLVSRRKFGASQNPQPDREDENTDASGPLNDAVFSVKEDSAVASEKATKNASDSDSRTMPPTNAPGKGPPKKMHSHSYTKKEKKPTTKQSMVNAREKISTSSRTKEATGHPSPLGTKHRSSSGSLSGRAPTTKKNAPYPPLPTADKDRKSTGLSGSQPTGVDPAILFGWIGDTFAPQVAPSKTKDHELLAPSPTKSSKKKTRGPHQQALDPQSRSSRSSRPTTKALDVTSRPHTERTFSQTQVPTAISYHGTSREASPTTHQTEPSSSVDSPTPRPAQPPVPQVGGPLYDVTPAEMQLPTRAPSTHGHSHHMSSVSFSGYGKHGSESGKGHQTKPTSSVDSPAPRPAQPPVPQVGGPLYDVTPAEMQLPTRAPSRHYGHSHHMSSVSFSGYGKHESESGKGGSSPYAESVGHSTTTEQTRLPTEAPSKHADHSHHVPPSSFPGHSSESGKSRSSPSYSEIAPPYRAPNQNAPNSPMPRPALKPSVPQDGGPLYVATPTRTQFETEVPPSHTSHSHDVLPTSSSGYSGHDSQSGHGHLPPSYHEAAPTLPSTHHHAPTTSESSPTMTSPTGASWVQNNHMHEPSPVRNSSESGKGRTSPTRFESLPTCTFFDCSHTHNGHGLNAHWDTHRGKGYSSGRHHIHDHSHDTPSAVPPQSPGSLPTFSPTIIRAALVSGFTIQQDSLGKGILSGLVRTLPSSRVNSISIDGFPPGAVVSYTDFLGNKVTVSGGDADGVEMTLRGSDFAALLTSLESLVVVDSPATSDYELRIEATSRADPGSSQTFFLPVVTSGP